LELRVFEWWKMSEHTDRFKVFERGLDGAGGEVGVLSDFTGELEFAFVVGLEEGLKEEFSMFDAVFPPAVGVGLSEEMGIQGRG
jgi:hypothetical protein